ncbi:GAF domain-containing protein [Agrococcus sp. UYP10]|uniref:GAF and ANTAR domain-containing protein n=1 Tax=Agrococcus sp. UYP10 TaxID=1756355 RepID=UPI0033945D3B
MTDGTLDPESAEAGDSSAPFRESASELLAPFLELLPVSGASISVAAGPSHSTLGSTDAVAAQLEQLQFELGEGPHWTALRSGRAVLVADVRTDSAMWPVFAAAASELSARALFAFPLQLGAATVGVVDLYRAAPGDLSGADVAAARSLALVASSAAMRLASASASQEVAGVHAAAPELRRVVHQATGILVVQLDVTATEAFARLRAHAFASGVPLDAVARDVVARRLTFHDERGTE